ncbi:armadillo-type protein [Hygrophoropsis aurantiaca]|uniref:Armadillo-type protein n=1 Tax=Hygrophoropsis aurantiaca TaxID=72124 RepID=A0ACB8AP18_9AGAM|nr:armadillo-type protein [Hygrophoropsis aurantiaca]
MSLVDFQHSNHATEEPSSQPYIASPSSSRTTEPPSHIHLAPPQLLGAFSLSPVSSPSTRDNPFDSPPLTFFTPPSTPLTSPGAENPPSDPTSETYQELTVNVRPPSPPLNNSRFPQSDDIETLPPLDVLSSPDFALDFTLDDEGLSTLEKIYLFSRSRSAHHRIYISHALPTFLAQVTPLEAVEYVLPLLPSLAMDEDEAVKEALASELVPIVWWFLTRCHLVEESGEPGDYNLQQQSDEVTLIPVQAFTPILGTLLLSPNGMVSGPTRLAVVEILGKIRVANDREEPSHTTDQEIDQAVGSGSASQTGFFGPQERKLFEEELIYQLVIGMGRLDSGAESDDTNEIWYDAGTPGEMLVDRVAGADVVDTEPYREAVVNPYFPELTSFAALPVTESSSISVPAPLDLPSPPPGIPPPQRGNEFRPIDTSPITSISLQREGADSQPNPSNQSPSPNEIDSSSPEEEYEVDPSEQAAVGRLASMSLIAAVAAGGSLRTETQDAFVKEVERVGKDPIYWVRREASFALGALAKVVPQEIVICSLLPLFESLRVDPVWHVRHSSLFALPAILTRLPPPRRHSVALSTIISLSRDESSSVRSGVLESLGEVVYTFHMDADGPPRELLRLFLGREEDRRVREQQTPELMRTFPSQHSVNFMLDPFYDDPARPLACAFNYPAIALTVGRTRWGELRALYLTLAQNRSVKIRRTLAASLGEMAKIIGPENAQRDLLGVWWDAMRCEEDSEIRIKAIESVPLFIEALGENKGRDEILEGLLQIWEEGWLRTWRARDAVIKTLTSLAGDPSKPQCIHGLLRRGLEDEVGAVRESTINAISWMWKTRPLWKTMLDSVRSDILALANSPSYRKRMTFVAYHQAVTCASDEEDLAGTIDDVDFWTALTFLADDNIVGVRIGVARFIGTTYARFAYASKPIPERILDLIQHLLQDTSAEVRSFVAVELGISAVQVGGASNVTWKPADISSTFSRPPSSMNRHGD